MLLFGISVFQWSVAPVGMARALDRSLRRASKVAAIVLFATAIAWLLLAAGEKGSRFALPNSRIMVHQPSGGFQGQASDIQRHAEDILKVKRRLNEIYVHHTGQSYEAIERTLDRDHFMSAEEAKAFGLVDEVTTKRAVELEEAKA